MGGCHSCDEKAAETSRECKATLKQIRERLALIFDRMDTHKEGSVTVEMAIKFLKLSRRDLSAGKEDAEKMKEIENHVKKIFNCARATSKDAKMSEDQFIAGYTNVLYPQNLSLSSLDYHLRRIFGRFAGPGVGIPQTRNSIMPIMNRVASI